MSDYNSLAVTIHFLNKEREEVLVDVTLLLLLLKLLAGKHGDWQVLHRVVHNLRDASRRRRIARHGRHLRSNHIIIQQHQSNINNRGYRAKRMCASRAGSERGEAFNNVGRGHT